MGLFERVFGNKTGEMEHLPLEQAPMPTGVPWEKRTPRGMAMVVPDEQPDPFKDEGTTDTSTGG